jgi:hypothetical protein
VVAALPLTSASTADHADSISFSANTSACLE